MMKEKNQGPTMESGALPPNPSDEIFAGRALRTVPAQAVTIRRPFADAYAESPLYFRDGQGCGDGGQLDTKGMQGRASASVNDTDGDGA